MRTISENHTQPPADVYQRLLKCGHEDIEMRVKLKLDWHDYTLTPMDEICGRGIAGQDRIRLAKTFLGGIVFAGKDPLARTIPGGIEFASRSFPSEWIS